MHPSQFQVIIFQSQKATVAETHSILEKKIRRELELKLNQKLQIESLAQIIRITGDCWVLKVRMEESWSSPSHLLNILFDPNIFYVRVFKNICRYRLDLNVGPKVGSSAVKERLTFMCFNPVLSQTRAGQFENHRKSSAPLSCYTSQNPERERKNTYQQADRLVRVTYRTKN